MTSIDFKKFKEKSFDAFSKAVIRNSGISLFRKEATAAKHQISINSSRNRSIDYQAIAKLEVPADAEMSTHVETFYVHGFIVRVIDACLAHALHLLTPKLRDAILLSSFTEMTDLEVATILGIPKSTLHDRKKAAIRRLHIHLTGKRG